MPLTSNQSRMVLTLVFIGIVTAIVAVVGTLAHYPLEAPTTTSSPALFHGPINGPK